MPSALSHDRPGDSARPLPLSAFMVVLPSKRGARKGAAWTSGLLVSLAIVVTVTVLATGTNPPSRTRFPDPRVPQIIGNRVLQKG